MDAFLKELVNALAARSPSDLPWVLVGLTVTAIVIWVLKGRFWSYLYVAMIPFLNWSFGKPDIPKINLTSVFAGIAGDGHQVTFNVLTIVTGFVFVVRDFVQREMGHRVLILMGFAIAWSFYYSWPVIALASAIAFAISESADWLIYTFTKYRLSTRILLSSVVAAPLDTTVFLYGADLAQQMAHTAPPGSQFNLPNWILFILGKMVGAVIVSYMIRRREDAGEIDPASPPEGSADAKA